MEKRWNLEDLVSKKNLNKVILEIKKEVDKFEKNKSKLTNLSKKDFYKILKEYELLLKKLSRVSAYSGLWFAEDSNNEEARVFSGKIDDLGVYFSNKTMFFFIWFKDLTDFQAKKYIEKGPYEYYLKRLRAFKKYTLSETEEKIINIKDVNGSEALSNLYDLITSNFEFDFKGKKLTVSHLAQYVRHKDPKIRKEAYEILLNKYKDNKDLIGEIYKYYIRDWYSESIDIRGHKDPFEISLLKYDLPKESIEALFKNVRKNKKIFQRYFKLKAKIIGMKKLRRYDIYAPYKQDNSKFSYESSVKEVLNVFSNFDSEMGNMAKRVFTENHVDNLPRKGKSGGAFCYTPLTHFTPYVLLNFIGKLDDKFTMSHELGHAVHSMSFKKDGCDLISHPPLPLAETASNFMEQVFFEHTMSNIKSKEEKKRLLMHYLDGSYASLIRQLYFSLFERLVIDKIKDGATIDEINLLWRKTLKEQFGDSVEIPESFDYEWMYISHFYRPFYCYSYTFGGLLVLALYDKYRKEGKKFIPKYKKILSYGGSEAPYKILKEANFNIKDEKFWQGGFDYIEGLIDELEKLC